MAGHVILLAETAKMKRRRVPDQIVDDLIYLGVRATYLHSSERRLL